MNILKTLLRWSSGMEPLGLIKGHEPLTLLLVSFALEK